MDSKGLVLGVTGLVLGVTGLAFSIFVALNFYSDGSFYLIVFGALASIPCAAIGLPLSGVAFYQSRESGTRYGVAIAAAGCVTGVVATAFSSFGGVIVLFWASSLLGWQ